MAKLSRDTLYSLEDYSAMRAEFRNKVMAHKKNRQVALGEHATLYFEDQLTMQYQVQEMLRIEKIFEAEAIQEEIDAYNPLIPDGSNFKATFMIEYDDIAERKIALEKLIGVEDKVWVRVEGFDKVYAIADEDMVRDNAEKTSAVHFLRFELTADMVTAARQGAALGAGIDHPAYMMSIDHLSPSIRDSLVSDLN
jgi:hypothetical protein